MAKKRRNKQAATNDLEILFPDQKATIAGKELTMRELRFGEQLQYNHLIQPIASLFDGFDIVNCPVEESADNVLDILKKEYQHVLQLMAICSRQSMDWLKSLPADEGEEIMLLWWVANSRFFIRRHMRKAQIRAQMTAAKITTGGQFLQPSSKQVIAGNNSAQSIPSGK